MAAYANLVQETTTTTGTGTYSLGGAVAPNRTFVNGVGDGVETVYLVADGSGIYEIARGTVTAGSPATLSRTAIIESVSTPGGTAGTSAINWGSGTKTVTMAVPASRLIAQAPDGASTVNLRAPLAAIDALTPAADRMIYYTSSSAAALLSCTSYGRSLLNAADASALRTLAGTVIGTDVQAYDADLAAIAALVSAADKVPYATGSGTWALADFTASGRALTAVSSIALGDLIYGSGSNAVSKLSGNTTTTKKFLRMTGSGSAATAPAWDTLVDGDIPAALTGKTYNGLTVTTSTGTLTIPNGATFATSGAYSVTLTATNTTALTLPTTGTLATLAGSETLTNKALNGSLGATTASTVAATTVDASGQITQTSTSNIFFVQSSAAATIRGTAFRTSGTERWRITCTADAESGSNVGSDYRIQRFSDAGSSLGSALIITRSTGVATFESSIVAGSAAATVIDSAGVVQLRSFTVATVPSASPAGREIYVSNESGGAITAFSDGTNWRRVSDRAIIS